MNLQSLDRRVFPIVLLHLCMKYDTNMNNNLIYGLRSPINNLYYYIGKTSVGYGRPITHLHYSHNKNVNEWIASLKAEFNIEPLVDIIESDIQIEDLAKKEIFWINEFYKTNEDMFNIQCVEREITTIGDISDSDIENLNKYLNKTPEIITYIRWRCGTTQDRMSSELGISRSTLSLLSRDKNVNLSVLKKSISFFMDHRDDKLSDRIRINR